jgi:dynactin-4
MAEVKEVPCPFDTKVMIKVRYLCSCGLAQPLSKLYFCRHCLDLRCGFCVSHEVDSHYCPNCLENMPSAEARLKKNRCANCFDCPSCGHTLSTRATSMQLQAPTEDGTNVKIVTKKLYYLVCAFCRWTSRDAGLQDQVTDLFYIFSWVNLCPTVLYYFSLIFTWITI